MTAYREQGIERGDAGVRAASLGTVPRKQLTGFTVWNPCNNGSRPTQNWILISVVLCLEPNGHTDMKSVRTRISAQAHTEPGQQVESGPIAPGKPRW